MGIDLPAAAIAWADLSPIGPFVNAVALNGYESNFRAFAALAQPTVKSALTTPPGSPADGDCHLVAVGGGAAWAGWDNRIVRYRAAGAVWESFIPKEGWSAYNQETDVELRFGGTTWAAKPLSLHAASHQGGSDTLAGQSIPGLLTTSSPTFAALTAGVGKIANWAYNAGYTWFGLPAFNAATIAASAGFAASVTGSIHLVAATGQGVNGWAGGVQKFQIDSTGVSIVSGSLQIAGVLAISGARAFDGTGLKLSGQTTNALGKFDASGNLISSGITDNGTYIDASRILRVSSMYANTLGYLGIEKTDGNYWKFIQSLATDALELRNHTTLVATFSPTGDIIAAGQIASSGMVLRLDTAYPTLFGCVFGDGVTPGANNYSLSIRRDNSTTYVNSSSKSALSINGSDRVVAQAAGVQFTGALTQDNDNKPRISSLGAFTGTQAKFTGLSGVGNRTVSADSAGNLVISNTNGNAGTGLLQVQDTTAASSIFMDGAWKGSATLGANTISIGDRVTAICAYAPNPANTGSYTVSVYFGGQLIATEVSSSIGHRVITCNLVANGMTMLTSYQNASSVASAPVLQNISFDSTIANTFDVIITPGNTSQRFIRYIASLNIS